MDTSLGPSPVPPAAPVSPGSLAMPEPRESFPPDGDAWRHLERALSPTPLVPVRLDEEQLAHKRWIHLDALRRDSALTNDWQFQKQIKELARNDTCVDFDKPRAYYEDCMRTYIVALAIRYQALYEHNQPYLKRVFGRGLEATAGDQKYAALSRDILASRTYPDPLEYWYYPVSRRMLLSVDTEAAGAYKYWADELMMRYPGVDPAKPGVATGRLDNERRWYIKEWRSHVHVIRQLVGHVYVVGAFLHQLEFGVPDRNMSERHQLLNGPNMLFAAQMASAVGKTARQAADRYSDRHEDVDRVYTNLLRVRTQYRRAEQAFESTRRPKERESIERELEDHRESLQRLSQRWDEAIQALRNAQAHLNHANRTARIVWDKAWDYERPAGPNPSTEHGSGILHGRRNVAGRPVGDLRGEAEDERWDFRDYLQHAVKPGDFRESAWGA